MSDSSSDVQATMRQALAANVDAAHQAQAALASLAVPLGRAAATIQAALLAGRKLLCCGNGGSAADSAHFAAEIAGRYVIDRPGYPAIDLTAFHSLTTALINDYPPPQLFARAVRALGAAGDVLAAFSTSGNSENIQLALAAAKEKRITTIAFLGRDGGACRGVADVELIVPSNVTARIQEAHLLMYHTICEVIDPALASGRA